MPARNCEMYAAEALRSLARQNYEGIFVVYVDDASEDQTGQIAQHHLNSLFPGRHDYIRNNEKFGKSRNIWEHLRPRAKSAEFIAILDADDRLEDPTILAEMASCYADGQDVVWSNFFTDTGYKGQNSALDPARSPRVQGWRTSHFFSFRAALLDNIPESYFKDKNGNWFMGACDVALALPILDQTRNYAFIPKLAYRYTASNPFSLHNLDQTSVGLSSTLQSGNAQQIVRMKPLPIWTETDCEAKETENGPMHNSVQPSLVAKPDSMATSAQWDAKAVEHLVAAHPNLLMAQAVSTPDLTPLQVLAFKQILQNTSGSVLCLGRDDIAVSLAALLGEHAAAKVTCLVESDQAAAVLEAKADLAGVSQRLVTRKAPRAPRRMGTEEAPFPSVAELEGDGPFSVVVADARGEQNEVAFAVLGLPTLAEYIAITGFHYCALTSDLTKANRVAEGALALAPSLTAFAGALGGTGCVIFANEKEQ
ncbi:MAG: glycosyltransferase family 2 protein [Epibacterium sp.]|nr:glycosyltransferase family 2 protein [Epibacterium sp.]